MKLRWTRRALEDLRHLHAYIAEDNTEAASHTVARIQAAARNLKKYPEMGKQGRCPGTREVILVGTPYVVVYILTGSELQIVAVIHTSMRWPDAFPPEGS